MEIKPVETTYVKEGDKIVLVQTTKHVCDKADLEKVKADWGNRIKDLSNKVKTINDYHEKMAKITDPVVRELMDAKAIADMGQEYFYKEKIDIFQKNIEHLQKQVDEIELQIKALG